MSEQAKKDRGSLKGGSMHTGGAKSVGANYKRDEKRNGAHSRKNRMEGQKRILCADVKALSIESLAPALIEPSSVSFSGTPLVLEVFKKTHVNKKENVSDPDVKSGRGTHKSRVYSRGSRNDVRQLVSDLEGIGSSRQAEAINSVQIAALSAQIEKLTAALQESQRKRVAEQENVSATVQQIKEHVLNLARRPTSTSSPAEGTNDDSEEDDDYIDYTP
uniref:Uncharacterized protein n=1 Tax=Solanum tuberosum TaxID=4113 RepID=M1DS65_SOLTU